MEDEINSVAKSQNMINEARNRAIRRIRLIMEPGARAIMRTLDFPLGDNTFKERELKIADTDIVLVWRGKLHSNKSYPESYESRISERDAEGDLVSPSLETLRDLGPVRLAEIAILAAHETVKILEECKTEQTRVAEAAQDDIAAFDAILPGVHLP